MRFSMSCGTTRTRSSLLNAFTTRDAQGIAGREPLPHRRHDTRCRCHVRQLSHTVIRSSSNMWSSLMDHQGATLVHRVYVSLREKFCNRLDRGVTEALK